MVDEVPMLNSVQKRHVAKVFPEFREQMAQYLLAGVDVVIYHQTECTPDVPAFAVAPKDDIEFWIGCWDSAEVAQREAEALGLHVVQ